MVIASIGDNRATREMTVSTSLPVFAVLYANSRRLCTDTITNPAESEQRRKDAQEMLDLMARIVTLVEGPDPEPPPQMRPLPEGQQTIEDFIQSLSRDTSYDLSGSSPREDEE